MILNSFIKAAVIHAKVVSMRHKGYKTKRHIIVLESDDWGSIRIPSLEARRNMQKQGVVFCSPDSYDRFDTLETNEDLTCLMETLASVRDSLGNPAKMTLNFVMANPDFEIIKKDHYQNYKYEPFTETYHRYPHCDKSFEYLCQGRLNGVFQFQFHGREHLNVPKWMRALRLHQPAVIAAFNEGCFSLEINDSGINEHFMEAYNADNSEDYVFLKDSIIDGLELFENIFGFPSTTMIPPCYTWDPVIEETSAKAGVICLQGSAIQRHSKFYALEYKKQTECRWIGDCNALGQLYTIRNCFFEPSISSKYGLNACLNDINKQFSLNHPAIISCHRQNFIGGLSQENRDKNINDLRDMLSCIVKEYPDVEFLSSDELASYIRES